MNKLIQKSAVISLFPAALITLILDYGSNEKTFITEASGKEIVHSGLDGLVMYIEKYGLLNYIISNIPAFLGIFSVCVILVTLEVKFKKRGNRGNE